MLDKLISYYKSAKDNKGTTVTIRNVLEQVVTDQYLKEVTFGLRNHCLPAVISTSAEFVSLVDEYNKEWMEIVAIREDIKDKNKALIKFRNKKGTLTYDDQEAIDIAELSVKKAEDKLNKLCKYGNHLKLIKAEAAKIKAEQKRDEYKTSMFPGVTWAGSFTKRAANKIAGVSDLIVMDIDKLDQQKHDTFKKLLKNDQYVFFLFTSPSGNGLKIVFKIDTTQAKHIDYFEAITTYIQQEYALPVDPSGKDVSRLCFLPSDPHAHFNEDCKVFPTPEAKEHVLPALTQKRDKVNAGITAYDIIEFTQGFITKSKGEMNYVEGSRNDFIFLCACNCYRRGIEFEESLQALKEFAHDLSETEILATVKSAYNDNNKTQGEFGKFAKKGGSFIPKTQTTVPSKTNSQSETATASKVEAQDEIDTNKQKAENNFIQFWSFYESEGKDGRPKKSFSLDYNKLKQFLGQQGFYRLKIDDVNYQFIRIVGNRVKPIGTLQIRDFIFDYLEQIGEEEAMNALTKGGKQFLSVDKFERLSYKEVSVKRHTEHEAFFYYQNGIVRVTPDTIELLPYTLIKDSYIWDSSVNKRYVTILDDESEEATAFPEALQKSEIYRFIWLACCNDKNMPEDSSEEQKNQWKENHVGKFAAHCTAIGYLLHRYKVPSKAKAIVAIDHQIPNDYAEQNGGTGKSIVGNYILRNMTNVSTIPGKDYKDENPWRWEPITIDSQIVFFNDVKRSFNFEGIFELVTDDMMINRRNIGYLKIPFEDSAKVFLATNFIPRGEGSSFKRRMEIIEFDNYFNDTHTPYDEFQHNLFQDWKGEFENQWNLYDNFMFRCVQMYLQEGLYPYPTGNYDKRKLVSECPQEFIDWMDATDEASKPKNVQQNAWIEKKAMFKSWIEEAKSYNLQPPSPHVFTKMVKKYCGVRDVKFTSKKTNGMEYYCFGAIPTSSPVSTQTSLL